KSCAFTATKSSTAKQDRSWCVNNSMRIQLALYFGDRAVMLKISFDQQDRTARTPLTDVSFGSRSMLCVLWQSCFVRYRFLLRPRTSPSNESPSSPTLWTTKQLGLLMDDPSFSFQAATAASRYISLMRAV